MSFSFRFMDKLSININDSQIQTVNLTAYGTGTTIISEPPMAPVVELGPQFSCHPCSQLFCLTNKGRRSQQIYWTTEGFSPFKTRRKTDYNPEDMKYHVSSSFGVGTNKGCSLLSFKSRVFHTYGGRIL